MNLKKITLLLLLLFVSLKMFSQVSVNKYPFAKAKKIKKEYFDRFKKSTTIFVLSNVHERSEYKKILDDVWTVTPYKLVDEIDYNFKDYYFGDYSIVKLEGLMHTGYTQSGHPISNIYIYLDVFLYDNESDLEEIAEGKYTKEEKLKVKVVDHNLKKVVFKKNKKNIVKKIPIGRMFLSPTTEFANSASASVLMPSFDVYQTIFNDDICTNNSLGFFKNNMQKLNSLIQEEGMSFIKDDKFKNDELKKIATETLYLPENIKEFFIKKNERRDTSPAAMLAKMKEEFTDTYDYKYAVVDMKELDKMILDKEPIYYLRAIFITGGKFYHIVNAQNGEVILKIYKKPSFKNYFKDKHIESINKAIKKALKK
ncbi:hypothetical protein [Aureivirga sp. CE67]|uniref:hypothetical protein n=1 Tax=Aureivirga sp. CE67 TaxID=1788983 RepID=UPI0018C9D8CC|nr:hypothetical protein [Aureivirga sp. CE67]